MEWRKHDIVCNRCGKYLFTECEADYRPDEKPRYRRENDTGNYIYYEIEGEFVCDDCRRARGE